jgi:hypothetical protein
MEKICCKLKIESKYGELICLDNFERRVFLIKEMAKIVEETYEGYRQSLAEDENHA